MRFPVFERLVPALSMLCAALVLASACSSDDPGESGGDLATDVVEFNEWEYCEAPVAVPDAPAYVPGGENITRFVKPSIQAESHRPEGREVSFEFPEEWWGKVPALVVCGEYDEAIETDCGLFDDSNLALHQPVSVHVQVELKTAHMTAGIYEVRTGELLEERMAYAVETCPSTVSIPEGAGDFDTVPYWEVAELSEVYSLFAEYVGI